MMAEMLRICFSGDSRGVGGGATPSSGLASFNPRSSQSGDDLERTALERQDNTARRGITKITLQHAT